MIRRKSDHQNRRPSDLKSCPYGSLWPETSPIDGAGALGAVLIKTPGPDNPVGAFGLWYRYGPGPWRAGPLNSCVRLGDPFKTYHGVW